MKLKVKSSKQSFDEGQRVIQMADPKLYDAIYGPTPTQQVNDQGYYAAKVIASGASTYDDMFASDDDISVTSTTRATNLSDGKTPNGEFMLVDTITLQSVAGSDVSAADFGLIADELRNGTIEIMQDNRVILKECLMERFFQASDFVPTGDTNAAAGTAVTYTMKAIEAGVYHLDNPKWLYPNEKIDVRLKLGKKLGADLCVRIELSGAVNAKM